MRRLDRIYANTAAAIAGEGKPAPGYWTRGTVTSVGSGVCDLDIFGDSIPDVVVLVHVGTLTEGDEVRVAVMGTDLCVDGVFP